MTVWKMSSTPKDPSRAVDGGGQGGARASRQGALAEIVYFGRGTTVATNARSQLRALKITLQRRFHWQNRGRNFTRQLNHRSRVRRAMASSHTWSRASSNTSLVSSGAVYQSLRAISFSSWPAPQPE
jgi:hypothetical protein